jgi:hypothetical protein
MRSSVAAAHLATFDQMRLRRKAIHFVATVAIKAGRLEIDAPFRNVRCAYNYGPEYLAYDLWAVTPEKRPAPEKSD